jgi:calcium/calmodulin-dependent protein kinase I
MDFLPGKIIDNRYEIVEYIKSGAFASVYRALDLDFDENEVAIKIIDSTHFSKHKLNIILNEPKLLQKLKHKNIIRLFEVIHLDSFTYIVMEYCRGGN